jgi:hypothetical protein
VQFILSLQGTLCVTKQSALIDHGFFTWKAALKHWRRLLQSLWEEHLCSFAMPSSYLQ